MGKEWLERKGEVAAGMEPPLTRGGGGSNLKKKYYYIYVLILAILFYKITFCFH